MSHKVVSAVLLMVQPVTSVQVPAASHVTDVELIVPSYPSAHDTVDVSPYVVPVVPVYEYPVLAGVSQSLEQKEKYDNFLKIKMYLNKM